MIRITDEGSVPEMRIWSILLIKSDLQETAKDGMAGLQSGNKI